MSNEMQLKYGCNPNQKPSRAYGFRVYHITNDDLEWADNIRREIQRIIKVK